MDASRLQLRAAMLPESRAVVEGEGEGVPEEDLVQW